jgi:hypothetical protein
VNLTFTPLAGILAAGNRAMIKPSETTPATSELLKQMFASAFDESEIAVVTGGPEVGQAFSSLPFDHLVFTGATSIGRHVMRAAAENLVPVTLELGGKSPVVIGRSADMSVAEVHDATAFAEILQAENLGFCAFGDGGVIAERGETRLGGRIPINPSGGLERKGHPIGATGLGQIYELTTQLRGEAGKRQVEGARFAIAENGGGFIGYEEAAACITILAGSRAA